MNSIIIRASGVRSWVIADATASALTWLLLGGRLADELQ
jgi:hypothetical protein